MMWAIGLALVLLLLVAAYLKGMQHATKEYRKTLTKLQQEGERLREEQQKIYADLWDAVQEHLIENTQGD